MIYRGYDIEETGSEFSITLEMPSGDKRHIATVKTLEIAQETVDEEKRILSLLKETKKQRLAKEREVKQWAIQLLKPLSLIK